MKKLSKEIIIIFVFVLLFSLYKIINISFGYDTDILILDHKNIMNSWIGISRYGLVFLKYVFRLYNDINIREFNIITYINVFLYTILYLYFLNINEKEYNIIKNILSVLIIVTSPILLEQYNFTLQSPEVSFSMILIVISFITTYKYLEKNKTIYAIITIVILSLIFGVYQAFINLYMLGGLIILYKLYNKENKNNLKNIIKIVVIFITSCILYFIISKIVIYYFNIPKGDYLANQIGWLNSFYDTFIGIIKDTVKVFIGYGHILNLGYLICFIIVINYILKNREELLRKIYLILILISPLFLNIITGSRIVDRSLFSLPFMMSFIFFNFYNYKNCIKYLLLILFLSQLINCYLLLDGDYKRYKNDVYISKKIYRDCDANSNTIIYLYGIEKSEENIKLFRGEVMGSSFYEWSCDGVNLTDYRVQNFMKILGMKYVRGNIQEQKEFQNEYPKENYIIKTNNECYVNFGK